MLKLPVLKIAAAASITFIFSFANALPADHTYVKSVLEKRFGLESSELGMKNTSIRSKDCSIRILDGSRIAGARTRDQAALQIMKGEKVLSFFISDRMSYDVSLGGVIDLTSSKKSGLTTHATLLKLSSTKLRITKLSLYPSENQPANEQTTSITCEL